MAHVFSGVEKLEYSAWGNRLGIVTSCRVPSHLVCTRRKYPHGSCGDAPQMNQGDMRQGKEINGMRYAELVTSWAGLLTCTSVLRGALTSPTCETNTLLANSAQKVPIFTAALPSTFWAVSPKGRCSMRLLNSHVLAKNVNKALPLKKLSSCRSSATTECRLVICERARSGNQGQLGVINSP